LTRAYAKLVIVFIRETGPPIVTFQITSMLMPH